MARKTHKATDRGGRVIEVGDEVEVPYEGRQIVTGLDGRYAGEGDPRNGTPIVTFKGDNPRNIPGLEGWEYADSVTITRKAVRK